MLATIVFVRYDSVHRQTTIEQQNSAILVNFRRNWSGVPWFYALATIFSPILRRPVPGLKEEIRTPGEKQPTFVKRTDKSFFFQDLLERDARLVIKRYFDP